MSIFEKFWDWYERNETFNIGLASILFLIQIIHLIWLTVVVVWERIFGYALLDTSGTFDVLVAFSDYLEIPAIIGVILFYIHRIRKRRGIFKSYLMLVFINSQWLHILWITDEIIVQEFRGVTLLMLPPILVWGAILIDYLELPVIYDTLRAFFKRLSLGKGKR